MSEATIQISVKKNNGKLHRTNIDVQYDKHLAEIKLEEIGKTILSINKSAEVTISYLVHNSVGGTWMELMAYYANEDRIVKF